MAINKFTKRYIKRSQKKVITSIEDIVRSILQDLSEYEDKLPIGFNDNVPSGYLYNFFYLSYKEILDSEQEIEANIKKSYKNIFSRKEAKILYEYSQLKMEDRYFRFGSYLAAQDHILFSENKNISLIFDYYKDSVDIKKLFNLSYSKQKK